MPASQIIYSEKYIDEYYEHRHVVLPQDIAHMLPKGRLLSEAEWRGLGIQQSQGWVHFTTHRPEPHIMMFRRPLAYDHVQMQMCMAARQAAPTARACSAGSRY